jgi:hypothetical protein
VGREDEPREQPHSEPDSHHQHRLLGVVQESCARGPDMSAASQAEHELSSGSFNMTLTPVHNVPRTAITLEMTTNTSSMVENSCW